MWLIDSTARSRRLVEEEGEVFRKGAVLLTPEEMEGEYDGEELRKEVRVYLTKADEHPCLISIFSCWRRWLNVRHREWWMSTARRFPFRWTNLLRRLRNRRSPRHGHISVVHVLLLRPYRWTARTARTVSRQSRRVRVFQDLPSPVQSQCLPHLPPGRHCLGGEHLRVQYRRQTSRPRNGKLAIRALQVGGTDV